MDIANGSLATGTILCKLHVVSKSNGAYGGSSRANLAPGYALHNYGEPLKCFTRNPPQFQNRAKDTLAGGPWCRSWLFLAE